VRPGPPIDEVLRPFPSAEHARTTMRRVRALLAADGASSATQQQVTLFLLCAKALDEVRGVTVRFAPRPGESATSAQARLGRVLGATTGWLRDTTGETRWPTPELPDRLAAALVAELGPWSLFLTAAEPHGAATLRALFDEVAAPDGRLDPDSAFGRASVADDLLDAVAFKTRSGRQRTIVSAALKAFGRLDALKERNRAWMRGNYKRGIFQLNNFPKLIHVELSTHCNLACRTCSITRPGRTRDLMYLSMETLERLRPALPFVSDCKLHGGGEPFMHPHIERVLEVFEEEGVRLNTVTNAMLIRERLGRLIGDGFSSLTVSVDGADRETYEYVRLKASWDRLHRGLDNINRFRNDDFRLIIGVVMLKCNIHQLPDLVRFAHRHHAQELQAAWLVPFHDLPWTYEQRLTDDPERTNRYMDEARAVGDELGISVRIPDNLPVGDAAPRPKVAHRNERGADRAGDRDSTIVALEHRDTYWDLHGTTRVEGHCRLMYDRAMILVDGRVKPCGQSRMVPELGSIHDRSFEQCWNSAGYQRLRSTFNGGTLPVTCQSCNFIRSKQLGSARLVY
jgi:radical SAM protein with 4Fe4S-binding SPASM domain